MNSKVAQTTLKDINLNQLLHPKEETFKAVLAGTQKVGRGYANDAGVDMEKIMNPPKKQTHHHA